MNAHIHRVACEWFVEFRASEPDERARISFLTWLRESPAHMAAYLEIAALWAESGAVGARERWSIEDLVSQARAEPDNVMVLPLRAAVPTSAAVGPEVAVAPEVAVGPEVAVAPEVGVGPEVAVAPEVGVGPVLAADARSVQRGFRRRAFVAAASLVLALGVGLAGWLYRQPDVYATAVGEQRTVTLADGSIVRLNARSKLAVQFSDDRRAVELREGQALFQVAKDVHRPFTVTSDGTRVQAVGTEFDVRRKRSSLVVTVVEGRVAVFDVPAGARRAASNVRTRLVYVSAGEQITTSSAGPGSARRVDPAIATAWTHRQLVFEATALVEVAEEFNLYNTRRLVIRDPALQTFQMDGVFSSPDPAPLIRFLRSKPGVRVIETESEIVIDSAAADQHGEIH
jgi:transmembrane sensor